jgi:hypothetical protein
MSSPNQAQTKALVDTSVLTNALLKPSLEGRAATTAIKSFAESQLPQYAIKEFKAGPLRSYVWFHNKVISCANWEDAVNAISVIWRHHNRQSTALRALADFQSSICKQMPANLLEQYPNQTLGEIQRAEAILWLKTVVFRAWRNREKLTTRVVSRLSCYKDYDPQVESNGRIDDRPVVCGVDDCCLRASFRDRAAELDALISACDQLPKKPETDKRRQALRQLRRFPDRPFEEKHCRALGDAVFALQCPKKAVIITTNLVDHGPLALAVGVSAISP